MGNILVCYFVTITIFSIYVISLPLIEPSKAKHRAGTERKTPRIFVTLPATVIVTVVPTMLRPSSFRAALRSRVARPTRFASTGSNPQLEAAQKKAQEVLSSTQQTATKALESAKKLAGPLGETAGKYLASATKSAGPLGERAGKLMGGK